jgi:hypothetical protein
MNAHTTRKEPTLQYSRGVWEQRVTASASHSHSDRNNAIDSRRRFQ